jgi:transketolase
VMRPAEGVETAECWEIALKHDANPSVLALSRQAVENLRKTPSDENLSAKGAYVLVEPEGGRQVTLIGTGSELALAAEAAKKLESEGIRAAVVSMPSMELFRAQPESYRNKVLGEVPRVAVEAGIAQCWYEWLGDRGRFVGLSDFGASAPAPQLYKHFGVTADAVAEAARSLVKK